MINTNHVATSDTPAVIRRRPNRAVETLGIRHPATVWLAVWPYGLLDVRCIQCGKHQQLGWPE